METYEEEEMGGGGERGEERENIRKSEKMHLCVYIIFLAPYIQAPIENFE